MHFPDPIPLLVTRPFALTRSVIDRLVGAPGSGQVVIRFPCVGVHPHPTHALADHEGFEFLAVRMLEDPQTDLTALATDQARNRRTVVVKGAMTALFVGPTPGRVVWVEMGNSLLTGILIHLIGF